MTKWDLSQVCKFVYNIKKSISVIHQSHQYIQRRHLTKIQHPFMILKTLSKLRIARNFHNLIKTIYIKPTTSIILNGEKLKALPLRSGKARMSPLTTPLKHHTGSTT